MILWMPDCSWKLAIIAFCYSSINEWIRKTELTKSESFPELIWDSTLGRFFKPSKKEK